MKLKKQLLEQTAHFFIAFVPIALVIAFPHWTTGGVAGLIIGALREWEQRPVERVWDMILDLSFCTLGGIVAGLVV